MSRKPLFEVTGLADIELTFKISKDVEREIGHWNNKVPRYWGGII